MAGWITPTPPGTCRRNTRVRSAIPTEPSTAPLRFWLRPSIRPAHAPCPISPSQISFHREAHTTRSRRRHPSLTISPSSTTLTLQVRRILELGWPHAGHLWLPHWLPLLRHRRKIRSGYGPDNWH